MNTETAKELQLIVLYDPSIKDKNRDLYIRHIKKEIPESVVLPIQEFDEEVFRGFVIALEPMSDSTKVKKHFELFPESDIEYFNEGSFTLSVTAKAIENAMRDVKKGDRVAIFNQSKTLGAPLACILINKNIEVHSFNSKSKVEDYSQYDYIITATGKDDFKIPADKLSKVQTIIDLSNDVDVDWAIRSVPTVKTLKNRYHSKR